MPDFGTKNVFFPHKKFRGKLSQSTESDNIVYVEFENEVRAYDNIKYPRSYVNRIIGEINANGNRDKIVAVWREGYCSWKSSDLRKAVKDVQKDAHPLSSEDDDLPF
ncbi:MAG: hypothetical protein CMP57_01975 [Flavobacteriales bacterium]|nr:hypothetical protein [Flavobacteriales bacterium]|tara:strand:+ start:2319 stop:2639 length:321 start_codon:yes stop_codon:yes gene_type:complete